MSWSLTKSNSLLNFWIKYLSDAFTAGSWGTSPFCLFIVCDFAGCLCCCNRFFRFSISWSVFLLIRGLNLGSSSTFFLLTSLCCSCCCLFSLLLSRSSLVKLVVGFFNRDVRDWYTSSLTSLSIFSLSFCCSSLSCLCWSSSKDFLLIFGTFCLSSYSSIWAFRIYSLILFCWRNLFWSATNVSTSLMLSASSSSMYSWLPRDGIPSCSRSFACFYGFILLWSESYLGAWDLFL